jgi:hypothetical protein
MSLDHLLCSTPPPFSFVLLASPEVQCLIKRERERERAKEIGQRGVGKKVSGDWPGADTERERERGEWRRAGG